MISSPFSPLALAAADVRDALDRMDGPLFGDAGAPSVALVGQRPLVEAVVLDLRRRRVRRVESAGGSIALTLVRHLGRGLKLALVTEVTEVPDSTSVGTSRRAARRT